MLTMEELERRITRLEQLPPINVDEARAHLGAALSMVVDSDERAIVDHIRAAYLHLGGKL